MRSNGLDDDVQKVMPLRFIHLKIKYVPEQLHQIRRMIVARLLCDNGDEVDSVQPHAFLLPGPKSVTSFVNESTLENL